MEANSHCGWSSSGQEVKCMSTAHVGLFLVVGHSLFTRLKFTFLRSHESPSPAYLIPLVQPYYLAAFKGLLTS